MAKPYRGAGRRRSSASNSRSGSSSRSPTSSRSRSFSGSYSQSRSSPSRSRSRSLPRSRSLSSSSSSPSRSASSHGRGPPPHRKSPAVARQGGSPVPQYEKVSMPPIFRKSSPVHEYCVLHVDSLSRNVHEGHLKEIFSNFGEVVHVELARERIVNLPKGYGYVEFKMSADAERAIIYMNGAQIDGNVVRARFMLPLRWKVSPPSKPIAAALK